MNKIKEIHTELILAKFPWIHEYAIEVCGCQSTSLDIYLRELSNFFYKDITPDSERQHKLELIESILDKAENILLYRMEWGRFKNRELLAIRFSIPKNDYLLSSYKLYFLRVLYESH